MATEINKKFKAIDTSSIEAKMDKIIEAQAAKAAQAANGTEVAFDLVMAPNMKFDRNHLLSEIDNFYGEIQDTIDSRRYKFKFDFDVSDLISAKQTRANAKYKAMRAVDGMMGGVIEKYKDYIGRIGKLSPSQSQTDYQAINKVRTEIAAMISAINEVGEGSAEADYRDIIKQIKQVIDYQSICNEHTEKFDALQEHFSMTLRAANQELNEAAKAVLLFEAAQRKAEKAEREAAKEAGIRAELEAKIRAEYEEKYKLEKEAAKVAKESEATTKAETEALKEQAKAIVDVDKAQQKSKSLKATVKEWYDEDVSDRAKSRIGYTATPSGKGKVDEAYAVNQLRNLEDEIKKQNKSFSTESELKDFYLLVREYQEAVALLRNAGKNFVEELNMSVTQKSIQSLLSAIRKRNQASTSETTPTNKPQKTERLMEQQVGVESKISQEADAQAESRKKAADESERLEESQKRVLDLEKKISDEHTKAGQPIPMNNITGAGIGSAGRGGGDNTPTEIKELLGRFGNATRNLWGYYSGSQDVTTSNFNLKQLKSYIRNNRKINEFLNEVDYVDFDDEDDDQEIGELLRKYPEYREKVKDAYSNLLKAKEDCAKDMQIIVAQGKAVGDIAEILSNNSIDMVARLDIMANNAFKNTGAYHAKYSQADNDKRVSESMRYLSRNAERHFTNNAFKKEGLLSEEATSSLNVANDEWGRHFAIVHSYFANVENVSDDMRKELKRVQEKISIARDEIAPTKVASKKQGVLDEQEEDALDTISWLSKNAGKYLVNTELSAKKLLKEKPEEALIDLESQWAKYVNRLFKYFNTTESVSAEVTKAYKELIDDLDRIESEVVPERVKLARESRSKSDSLSGKSAKDKAVRAYEYFNNDKNEYKYRRLEAFNDAGLLSNNEKAELDFIKRRREKEDALISAYDSENKLLSDQASLRKEIEESARKLAIAELARVQGNKANSAQSQKNKYQDQVREILDAQYRYLDLSNKRENVGLSTLEISALETAKTKYEELYNSLSQIEDKTGEVAKALNNVNVKEKEVSGKLSQKWSDQRARRYGSALIGDDSVKYNTREDVVSGLSRYAKRVGARDFNLIDKQSIGDIQKFRAEVQNLDGSVEILDLTLNRHTGTLDAVSKGTRQATSFFESFGEGLKKRAINLAQYAMTFASLRSAMAWIKQGINQIREFDAAFVELSRISNDSASALEEFKRQSFELADAVGGTATQITNAAAEWEHLGYNIKDATELAKTSAVYTNIADGMSSASEATEDLVSIMKAYKIPASEAMDVTDALIAVSNNYAVTAADIGNALKRSASAMSVANNTFEQNVALATAMAEVTQNAEKSGSALSVLSLRIRGAKTELQEMGEDTDDMASSTSKLRAQVKGLTKGFDIMRDDKTFKQTYEIMEGIAKVWDDLDDISRASLLETLAG